MICKQVDCPKCGHRFVAEISPVSAKQPMPSLLKFLTKNYDFSTQADAALAMEMAKEIAKGLLH